MCFDGHFHNLCASNRWLTTKLKSAVIFSVEFAIEVSVVSIIQQLQNKVDWSIADAYTLSGLNE